MPRKTKAQKKSAEKRRNAGTLYPAPSASKKRTMSDVADDRKAPVALLDSNRLSPEPITSALMSRILGAADKAMRMAFPTDYYKRCYYSAFVISDHLRSLGHDASVTGGIGYYPVTGPDTLGWDGYHVPNGPMPAHAWASTPDFPIIDIMPIYDVRKIEGRGQRDQAPALWWKGFDMPSILEGYIPRERLTIGFDKASQNNYDRLSHAFQEALREGVVLPVAIITSKQDFADLGNSGSSWARRIYVNQQALAEGFQQLRRRFGF